MRFPVPPTPYAGHSDLHFATEEQIRSRVALAGHDRGELTFARGHLTFRGMSALVDCPGVAEARLVGKAFPWVMVAAVAAAAGAAVYLTAAPGTPVWRQPLAYLLAGILLVGCVRQARERWVEVTYADGGRRRRAYFRRQPTWFGSGARRTAELLRRIEREVLGGPA